MKKGTVKIETFIQHNNGKYEKVYALKNIETDRKTINTYKLLGGRDNVDAYCNGRGAIAVYMIKDIEVAKQSILTQKFDYEIIDIDNDKVIEKGISDQN